MIDGFVFKDVYGIDDLLQIMRCLRSEGGCPWDREQTHESIKKNLIEETYEVIEAINKQDRDLLCEELGDVLMQVVFHAQMEAEAGSFTFENVADGVCKKLIERHPRHAARARYIETLDGMPVWTNTETKYFRIGEEMFDSMCKELRRAQKFIFLEYFIIEEGIM